MKKVTIKQLDEKIQNILDDFKDEIAPLESKKLWYNTILLTIHFSIFLWVLSQTYISGNQVIGVKDPTSPAKNFKKRIKTERKIIEWAESNNMLVMCGHTHRPVFADNNNVFYFNAGSCVHPRCITGIEIVNDNITLIKWCVKTKDDGSLFVAREILSGSKKLKEFFQK